MKYLIIITLFSLSITGCKEDNCFNGSSFNDNNIRIHNTFDLKYSEEIIKDILKISRDNGLKEIDSIQIGFVMLPAGFDSTHILVYEKECITNNNKDVRRRELELRIRDLESVNRHILNQFKDIKVNVTHFWRYKIDNYIVNISQDESINYEEVEEILNLFKSHNYIVQCDTGYFSPQEEVYNIFGVWKKHSELIVQFDYCSGFYALQCLKKNNKLIVKEIIRIMA
jgi:hypothetical protein